VLTGLTLPAPAASATAAVEAPSHAPVEAVPAAAFPTPKPPVTLPAGIEDRATYVPNNSCAATTLPGTTKLAALLQQNYGIGGWAPRDCGLNGAGSVTEHYDGRGYDWYTTVRNANSKAAADHFINWLMATDSAGNPYANFRRMGIMYVIWNDYRFPKYNGQPGWDPYRDCTTDPAKKDRSYDTFCHRDHVHFSMSWEGARAQTSFWSGKVAAPDYGPCRLPDLNWAPPRTTPNPTRCDVPPAVTAPPGSSALLKDLYTWSGMVLGDGSRGPVVKVIQTALGVTPDGVFGPATLAALQSFQSRAGVPVTGVTDVSTWRALLAEHGNSKTPRLAGSDRYATAATIAAQFPAGVDVAYITTGTAFPDALAAAAAAGNQDAPVLLTRPGALPAAAAAQLDRLKPRRIVVVGGTESVSDEVMDALTVHATTGQVTRLAGSDRYATSAAVSATFAPGVDVAYIASGADFPDALAGAAAAGVTGGPVLLTRPGSLPAAVRAELTRLAPKRVVILGGEASVTDQVRTQLVDQGAPVTRLAGSNRYGTAAAVSAATNAPGVAEVFIASGADFPDALAGAALAGARGAALLLTAPASLPTATANELDRLAPRKVTVLGSAVAVSDAVAGQLARYAR
jgi:putative cell wall-binding protein/peptidoglycan hydrolase-like protein with peptidoglycan-binding domain